MIREQIMQTIEADLGAIRLGNSVELDSGTYIFKSDAGHTVSLRRTTPLPEHFTRAVDIRDPRCERDRERAEFGTRRHLLSVEINIVAQGEAAAVTVRKILSDVVAVIAANRRWSGLADWTDTEAVETEQAQGAKPEAYATLTLTVRYRAPHWEA